MSETAVSLAAKVPLSLWASNQDLSPEMFVANAVAHDVPGFLYDVRKVTAKEAYAISPKTYDLIVRNKQSAPGTSFYWFSARLSKEPL